MLEDLRRRTGRFGLEVILINVWEGGDARAEAQRFADLWGVDGAVLLDETGSYARELGVRGVPTNVLVDADGVVRAVGATNPDELEAAVERLLGRARDGAAADDRSDVGPTINASVGSRDAPAGRATHKPRRHAPGPRSDGDERA